MDGANKGSGGTAPKKELGDRLRRRLKKGESVYWSSAAQYCSSKSPDGRWVAKIARDERGKWVRYPTRSFVTPEEAVRYAESTRGTAELGRTSRDFRTVADLVEFCQIHRSAQLSALQIANKSGRWLNHLEPYWGNWRLDEVRRVHAQEWLSTATAKLVDGKGAAQLDKCRIDMHGYFRAAIELEMIDRANPFDRLVSRPLDERRRVTLESRHFAAVLGAMGALVERCEALQWAVDVWTIALLTGMRRGEVLALRRHCIDVKRKTILVDRALARQVHALDERGSAGAALSPVGLTWPKGGSARNPKARVVAAPDQLMPTLTRLLEAGHQAGDRGLAFSAANGNPKEVTRLRMAIETMMRRLKVLRADARTGTTFATLPDELFEMVFRDTRNSFASYAAEVGIPEATRMALLGHTGSSVTMRSYTDLTAEALADAQSRLSRGWHV